MQHGVHGKDTHWDAGRIPGPFMVDFGRDDGSHEELHNRFHDVSLRASLLRVEQAEVPEIRFTWLRKDVLAITLKIFPRSDKLKIKLELK